LLVKVNILLLVAQLLLMRMPQRNLLLIVAAISTNLLWCSAGQQASSIPCRGVSQVVPAGR
jgi:hypothetical protein